MENIIQIEDNTFGVSRETIDAFYQQWEHFPEFAALIRKDRRVIGVNKAGRELGFPVGIKCYEIGGKDLHKDCLANQALAENATKIMVANSKMPGSKLTTLTFWVPLHNEKDLYVHFNIDITKLADQKKVSELEGIMAVTPSKIIEMSATLLFNLLTRKKTQ